MSNTTTDPLDLLASLDGDAIAARIAELDAERRALYTLLRAARAREYGRRCRRAPEETAMANRRKRKAARGCRKKTEAVT